MLHYSPIALIFLMRFLQTSVDAAYTNVRLKCHASEDVYGTLQTELQFVNNDPITFIQSTGDLCAREIGDSSQRVYFCNNCLVNCGDRIEKLSKNALIVADVKAPNPRLSWFHIQTPSSPIIRENNLQCNVELQTLQQANSNMDETSTDALRSFSKTSVLFVSISFIILMVISLAWLVFYYVQRFRYAHAKDRLQRRLFNAARKALARIPTRHVRASDEELQMDCAVCLDPYQANDLIRVLPCKHAYHKSCIDPWLLEHRTCPMCKADILKYFGYNYGDHVYGRPDDMGARIELGADRERGDRAIMPQDIVSPEGTSESSESAGFSFDHSEHVENFTFTPSVPPQLVLNASNAKSFMPMSGRVGSTTTVQSTTSSGNTGSSTRQQSYSARGHRSSNGSDISGTPAPNRVVRPQTACNINSNSNTQVTSGQIVNLVQVKSKSVTRAATIRKESLPTPIDITSDHPPTTSTSSQVV